MTSTVDPVAIIAEVCRVAGGATGMNRVRRDLDRAGVVAAVAARDTGRLYDWLMVAFSFQGIADARASAYIEDHGNVTYRDIAGALARRPDCPKLARFETYRRCGYRKAGDCAEPRYRGSCPVPTHDLRKGGLNQLAYSLFLFLRDRCDGDLVGFIDRTLAGADRPGHPDRVALMRGALLDRFRLIFGVSDKLLNMAFADLLIGADPKRSRWVEAGASMVAVDTLVHNFMARTGILARTDAGHPFGPACYRDKGCAGIIDRAARRIDARAFDPRFPIYFPRFVQYSIWAFCAEQGIGICNGNRIDDRDRCGQRDCPIYPRCGRVALNPVTTNRRPATAAVSRPRPPP
jgi:hypothetical protein